MRKIVLTVLVVLIAHNAFGKVLIKADKGLKKIFPKAERFEQSFIKLSPEQIAHIETEAKITFFRTHSPTVIKYDVFQEGARVAHAFEDTVMGKWGPIHYLAAIDLDGVIIKVIILDYEEIRGKPIAKKRYLKQYRGKTLKDPLRLRKDIDGVTGATISSRSITNGIRKMVHIFDVIK